MNGEMVGVLHPDGSLSSLAHQSLGVTVVRTRFDSTGATNLRDSTVSERLLPAIRPWRRDLLDQRSQSIGSASSSHYACGVPLRCFDGSDFDEAWPEPVRFGLISLGDSYDHRRVIPIRPRPIEYACNTAAWGAVWLVLLLLPRLWMIRQRRAKGLCAHCGYDLQGQYSGACPECGSAHQPILSTPRRQRPDVP